MACNNHVERDQAAVAPGRMHRVRPTSGAGEGDGRRD
mgnify:CR=1 FL=1